MIRQVYREMLEQIHNKLKSYQLREGFKGKDDFNVSTVVNPQSITKWEGKTAKSIVTAAKKKDKSAIEYIFWKMKGAITGTFWANFLGPNPTIRNYRIQKEDAWEQWLGLAWESLTGGGEKYTKGDGYVEDEDAREYGYKSALDLFDPSKVDEERIWPTLGLRYKNILKNTAQLDNFKRSSGGLTNSYEAMGKVSQYEPTWADSGDDDDDTSSSGDSTTSYRDTTFDEMYENSGLKDADKDRENEVFLDKWRQFTQDPELQEKVKNVSQAMVFHEVLDNPAAEFRAMGTKFGISRNSVATLMARAQDTLAKYGITGQELMNAVRTIGNDKIASYLMQPIESPPETNDSTPEAVVEQPTAPPPKPDKNGDFKTRFAGSFEDPKMWAPHRKGYDAANILYRWVDDKFPSVEALTKKYWDGPEEDIKYWLNRAFKVLKSNGISQEDIKAAVKQYGKKAITDLIGEDN